MKLRNSESEDKVYAGLGSDTAHPRPPKREPSLASSQTVDLMGPGDLRSHKGVPVITVS